MKRNRPAQRCGLARCLLLALAAHLLAIPLVGRAFERDTRTVPEVTELEVVWTPPPRPPIPPPSAVSRASAPPPSDPRTQPSLRRRRPRRLPPPPSIPDRSQPNPIDLSMRPARPGPELNLSDDFEVPAPRVRSAASSSGLSETSAQRGQRLKRRLDRMLVAGRPRRNVTEGKVHPVLYDMERDATSMFRPDWSLTEGDARGRGSFGRSVTALARALGESYKQNIDAFMYNGNKPATSTEDGRSELLDGYTAMAQAHQKEISGFRCLVCAEITPAGPQRLRVVSRSGSKVFDRLALTAMKKALRSRPVPKDAEPVEACYRFNAKFFRVPPVPLVGCSFDESVPTISCFYPGKKVLKVGVELRTAEKL